MRGTLFLSIVVSLLLAASPAQAQDVVPLGGPQPAWLTEELQDRLTTPGTALPAPNDAPLPAVVGIRPGALMFSPKSCTMSHVFRSGSALAIGTAGHCVQPGQPVVLLTLSPTTNQPVLVTIGSASFSRANGVGDDFALVPIHPSLTTWVSPTTALLSGPCGAFTAAGLQLLTQVGHGTGIGTGGTPRAGLSQRFGLRHFTYVSPSMLGDSGSPVQVAGTNQAVGTMTHLVVDAARPAELVAGTRIAHELQLAAGWTLATSPFCR